MSVMQRIIGFYLSAITLLEGYLTPLFGLGIRGYLAWVFFRSGLTKIQSWDSTLWLFENEYSVPYLPTDFAAGLATATELTLPAFILLGLGSRIAAAVLFIFNAIAVISYPDLDISAVRQHYLWGALMLVLVFHGAGKLSLDALLKRRCH